MIGHIARFGIVGVLATALDYFFYVCFLSSGVHYLIANFAAFCIASIFGYWLNLQWVWRRPFQILNLVGYYLVQGLGLLSASAVLFFLVSHGISSEVAKLLAICIVPAQTFLLNRFVVFR